jgi:hypothetical protein
VDPAVIELDLSPPWEPPEAPAPRLGRGRRWLAAVLVGVLALGLLVAGAPVRGDGPTFQIEHQVLSVYTAGGRLFVGRFAMGGASTLLEAYSLRDGTPLWSVPTALNQQVALATGAPSPTW